MQVRDLHLAALAAGGFDEGLPIEGMDDLAKATAAVLLVITREYSEALGGARK